MSVAAESTQLSNSVFLASDVAAILYTKHCSAAQAFGRLPCPNRIQQKPEYQATTHNNFNLLLQSVLP
jgi:hypothetical protein